MEKEYRKMDKPTRRRRRSGRRRRTRRRARLLSFSLLFCLLVGLSAIGYASWRVDQALDDVAEPRASGNQTLSDPFAMLILGSDHRPELGTNLTDVIIVAAIDFSRDKIAMVSIPRDTKVRLDEVGRQVKANEAYSIGERLKRQRQDESGATLDGPALAKRMVERLLDIPIDYYALVDFRGFMALVDEVGGIEVKVERELIYSDPTDGTFIHLYPGWQHVNGKEALDWVRHRLDDRGPEYYSSDFDRNRRQREVVAALAQKLTTFDGATKIFDVLDIMSQHIRTDFSKDQIKSLLREIKDFDPERLISVETPNVYWDGRSMQTVIPEEDLQLVRLTFREILNGKDD